MTTLTPEQNRKYYKYYCSHPEFSDTPQRWYFNHLKDQAVKRRKKNKGGIKWRLSFQQFCKAFEKPFCRYSGLPIIHVKSMKQKKNQTASLDRISSGRGYDSSNVVRTEKVINKMKNHFSVEVFVDRCMRVARHMANEYPEKWKEIFGDVCPVVPQPLVV